MQPIIHHPFVLRVGPFQITGFTINLTWTDDANNENSTKIQRCQDAGCSNFTDIASVGPDVASYNDTGLPASTTFACRVIAHTTRTTPVRTRPTTRA